MSCLVLSCLELDHPPTISRHPFLNSPQHVRALLYRQNIMGDKLFMTIGKDIREEKRKLLLHVTILTHHLRSLEAIFL